MSVGKYSRCCREEDLPGIVRRKVLQVLMASVRYCPLVSVGRFSRCCREEDFPGIVRRKVFQVLSEGRHSRYCKEEGIQGIFRRKVFQVLSGSVRNCPLLSGGKCSRYCRQVLDIDSLLLGGRFYTCCWLVSGTLGQCRVLSASVRYCRLTGRRNILQVLSASVGQD